MRPGDLCERPSFNFHLCVFELVFPPQLRTTCSNDHLQQDKWNLYDPRVFWGSNLIQFTHVSPAHAPFKSVISLISSSFPIEQKAP